MSEKKYDILSTESGDYETSYNKMYLSRKPWEPVDPKKILSFMPGTVEKIKVKKGDKVEEGQSLMIFRAMKMSNNILSPIAGKVKSVNVSEGENLAKNVVMIELS